MNKIIETNPVSEGGKSEKISIFSFAYPHMRTFHITWISFMVCFFAWFAIAPLMAVVREEFQLTKSQIGNIIIASVSMTIFARLVVGWLTDKIGPRITYTGLLIIGAIPVMAIGFTYNYETFLIARLCIGVIGASFVITQYHTSAMFGSRIVGTANAIAGGWGNLGGGLTQIVMPLIFGGFIVLGFTGSMAWRYSMLIPGLAMLIMAFVYYRYTQDTPEGNFSDIRKNGGEAVKVIEPVKISEVLRDHRVWILFLIYGCSFGVEITIDNIAALYFKDTYGLTLAAAGLIAGMFGFMNIFARALGGILSDKVNVWYGLKGRSWVLAVCLFLAGLGMVFFSQMASLIMAVVSLIVFALFVKMSNGATYSIVPFMNKRAIGMVSGIVGAGGNMGAMLMGIVLKMEGVTYQNGIMYIGIAVSLIALLALFIVPVFQRRAAEVVAVVVPVPAEESLRHP